jgi:hypothetical protein
LPAGSNQVTDIMQGRNLIAAVAPAATLLLTLTGAQALNDAKYPDRKGQSPPGTRYFDPSRK